MPELIIKNLNIAAILPELSQSFDFSVSPGNCLGINGPSGIGKSVFLKALADMLPHEGEVFLDDIACQSIPAPQWRRQVTLLPAESQWWADRVGEHFKHFEAPLFNSLGFDEAVMDWQIVHLSSGEKQRLACIRVLMNQPKALLMDEPTANLDKDNRLQLEKVIADYQTKHQIPILWISHDQEQLARVSQSVLMLNKHHYEIRITAEIL
ncbi:MAG: ABC transporter ATP-binding protein [gamma proteobacterium symbiont of Taylorina sp.]|nr:ABC transporter ATP-binding protein [gamma proteobacterium symbiont of Taylorina sp.]